MNHNLTECHQRWVDGELSNGEWLYILIEAQAEALSVLAKAECDEGEKRMAKIGINPR